MLFESPLWSSHSIFRRPYFLTRFLPALLTPRVVSVSCYPSPIFVCAFSRVRLFSLHDMHKLSFICSFLWKSMLEWVSSKRWKSEFLSERWKCQQVIPTVCSLIKFLVVLSDNIEHHHHNMNICYFLCVFRADKIPAAQYSSYMESCQKQRQQNSGYSFKGPLTLLLLFILKMDIICLIISTVQWKSIQGLLISSVLCAFQNWKLKQTLIKHNKVQIVRSWWSWVLRSYRGRCCNSLKDETSNRRTAFLLRTQDFRLCWLFWV